MKVKKIYRILFKLIVAIYFILLEKISPEMGNFIKDKFGIFTFFIPLYFILSAVVDMLKERKMRILYKTRLIFLYLLILSLGNLLIFIMPGGMDKENLIDIAFNKYDYGEYFSTLLYYLNFELGENVSLATSGVIVFLALFVFFGKFMGAVFRGIKHYFSKAGKNERAEKRLKNLKKREAKRSLMQKQKEIKKLAKQGKKQRKASIAKKFENRGKQTILAAAQVADNINKVDGDYEASDTIFKSSGRETSDRDVESYDKELDSIIDELENSEAESGDELIPKNNELNKFLEGKDAYYIKAYELLKNDRNISVVKLQSKLEIGYEKAKDIHREICEELDRDDTSI